MSKGLVYKQKGVLLCETLFNELDNTILELKTICTTNIPIGKGAVKVGYGISQSNKNIKCDQIISILREIKRIKGW